MDNGKWSIKKYIYSIKANDSTGERKLWCKWCCDKRLSSKPKWTTSVEKRRNQMNTEDSYGCCLSNQLGTYVLGGTPHNHLSLDLRGELYEEPWSKPIEENDWSEVKRQERWLQIRVQLTANRRPKAPKITQTPLASPDSRGIKDTCDIRLCSGVVQQIQIHRERRQNGNIIEMRRRWTLREFRGFCHSARSTEEARRKRRSRSKVLGFEREFRVASVKPFGSFFL